MCPNGEQSVGSLQQCGFHIPSGCSHSSENNFYTTGDEAYTTEDDAYTVDDGTPTVRPKTVCAISELRDQQPTTTKFTSADFKVLDELTEDLLVAVVKRSLNVSPMSMCC